ncbi:hypothetical protein V5799_015459 [Amblyomma americanum]|uniref:Tetraspanin n=1 Tax=Amblyomma americanum TaxID=6943 RepID=A0AAQ4F8Z7_AMBAM
MTVSRYHRSSAQQTTLTDTNCCSDGTQQRQDIRDKIISTTTEEHASFRVRGVIVGVNLAIVLLALVAFWCAAFSYALRPSQLKLLLHNLMSKSPSFTLLIHLDAFTIALSVALGTVSACGMVGALRENVAVLEVYQRLLAILIMICSLLALATVMAPHSVRNHLKESAYVEFIQGYRHSDHFQYLIDALQASLRCCGFSSDTFRDWEKNEYFRCATDNPSNERCSVPNSCCRSRVLGVNGSEPVVVSRFCGRGVLLMEEQEAWRYVYTRSCADAVLTYVMDNLVTFVGVAMLFNIFLLTMLDPHEYYRYVLISHPHRKIRHHIYATKSKLTSTSENVAPNPHHKIGNHIHIRKSDKIGCVSTLGNRTSQPHQEIGHHIHIRKPDITTTSENHIHITKSNITSTSQNRTSHPHHKIGHHIHITKLDITSTSGNRTSHPHQEIGPHIHIRKSDITYTTGNQTSHPHQEIRHHIHIRKSDISTTSGNRTSHPHHKIRHHIHITKSDITSTSQIGTSHSHHKIRHHIHITKSDTTSASQNRASHPHHKIGPHIHITKSVIIPTSQNRLQITWRLSTKHR